MLDPLALQAFLAVAEVGHFVRAADRLGVAQSVVSKRLKRLEDQLGVRLVDRGKRHRVGLTRIGEQFLAEAHAAVAALQKSEDLGRKFARGEAGPVRIGFVLSAVMAGVLPAMIRAVRTGFPELDIHPVSMETPDQIAAVRDGRIDYGIIRPRPTYPDTLIATTIHRDDAVLALSDDHPLARQSCVARGDIAADTLIVPQFHEDVGLIDMARSLVGEGSPALMRLVRTTDFVTAAGLAVAGVGLVIAPRSLARLSLDGLCFRDIAAFEATFDLVLIARMDAPATVHQLLQRCEFRRA